MLSNTIRLYFCYLKIIRTLHPHYHPKIIGLILKNKLKNGCAFIYEILRFIVMKMKMKIKKDHIDLCLDMDRNIVNKSMMSQYDDTNMY